MKIIKLLTTLVIFGFILNSCSNLESGHIKADISKLTIDFDKVVVEKMIYDYSKGNLTFVNDTICSKNGRFDYYYKVNEPLHMSFYLINKNKIVAQLSFLDNYSKTENFWFNPLFGNEQITFLVDKIYKTYVAKKIKVYRIEFKGSEEADMFIKLSHYKMLTNENINKNPSNYALLYQLFEKRDSYELDEIKKLSLLFSEELKKSKTFILLENYMKTKLDLQKNGYKNNFYWEDIYGKTHNFDQAINGKENLLLIFWASWCVPCRKEIPELKKFYKKYNNNLSLVSLSIDDNFKDWKKALIKEKMPWLNLSGLPKNKNSIKLEYNISVVPTMVLVNKEGKILKQVTNDLPNIEISLKQSIKLKNRKN